MTADLKPYPEYKNSSVPWLGEVPKHWGILPNRALFTEVNERNHPHEEMLSVTITRGVIRQQALLADSSKKDSSNQNKMAYKLVQPHDIAYNKMRAWQGAIGVSDLRGIISPAYVVMRLRGNSDPRYFHYLFRTPHFAKEAERWSYGITSDMWSLRPEHFKMIYACLPPLTEQSAIVRFLDHFDHRINRLIRAKQKLIKLLEEEKQVIIHRAVTCGLDPNVRLKPSGVEWLGDVPEHWEILPLKNIALVQSGLTLGKNYFGRQLTEFPYLRVANVQDGYLNLSEIKTIFVPEEEAVRSTLQSGDVLMTEGGDPDKLGRGCIWEGQIAPCLHQNHIFAVRPRQERLLPHFLVALLSSQYAKVYFLRTAKQTTNLASTNKTTIGQFPVLLPSLDEQSELLAALKSETGQIDRTEEKTQREISLLREYRTRLIADMVTGKLDVRGVELPEEVEEAEVLEDLDGEGPTEDMNSDVESDGEDMAEETERA